MTLFLLPCRTALQVVVLSAVMTATALSAEPLTLAQTLELLKAHNPELRAAAAGKALADAAMQTAKAYPNPDLEVGGGASTGIGPGALNGDNQLLYLSQPLDLPFVREARQQVAAAGIEAAESANRAVWLVVKAKTQQAFYAILQRQAELALSQENEQLLSQIRDKVALKVQVGEAAMYEQVKAEAEWLNAVNLRAVASLRAADAKSALQALFVGALPSTVEVQGTLPSPPPAMLSREALKQTVLAQQPQLLKARAELQKAEAQRHLEENKRYPVPTLKAGAERDPGLEQWRVMVSVPLPLWNQRQGPIAEAVATVQHWQAEVQRYELLAQREVEAAYNQFDSASRQVETFENGLLTKAEKALQVAEAAYRLGQRGILDYLDAQRSYRTIRNEYLNAQFDRQYALIELERLYANDGQGVGL
jgi:cobalt-zinc-cadmium efflux system outer membrane protein